VLVVSPTAHGQPERAPRPYPEIVWRSWADRVEIEWRWRGDSEPGAAQGGEGGSDESDGADDTRFVAAEKARSAGRMRLPRALYQRSTTTLPRPPMLIPVRASPLRQLGLTRAGVLRCSGLTPFDPNGSGPRRSSTPNRRRSVETTLTEEATVRGREGNNR
jgi:hypothetical protein